MHRCQHLSMRGRMPRQPDTQSRGLLAGFAEALRNDWRASLARTEQLAPPGNWITWIFAGGRGAGKTRSGAEWVRERVETGVARRIHLVAPTAADARDVLVEGPAGLLAISPQRSRPIYSPSLRKLEWPSGAVGLLFSSDEPDRLRGPQCDTLWLDEFCAFRRPQDVLDMAMFGLRLGKGPRALITTTPRPIKPFRDLLARDGQDVVVTRCSTRANAANLAPPFLDQILSRFTGTRLGRQEIDAELLEDVPGALWQLARIEELRVREAPVLTRIVVAIDPATTSGEGADETGIIVAGIGQDGHLYVLDDLSGRFQPSEWAKRAIAAYHAHKADRIVAEVNQGGDMVEATLRSVDGSVPYRAVHASRGKLVRAEPVSALYERGVAHHVGAFARLEDQLTSYDGQRSGGSPDRLDALVWAMTELMSGVASFEGWCQFIQEQAGRSRAAHEMVRSPALPGHERTPPVPADDWDLITLYRETAAAAALEHAADGEASCGACGKPLLPGGSYILQGKIFHADCWKPFH